MRGRIVRIISNLYTVESEGKTYDCRARGLFRNNKITPLVGDIVEFDDQQKYILKIEKRKNELIRPTIANVDTCIIVTTVKRPDFSSFLLDKLLTNIIINDIEPIICFTKYDLLTIEEKIKIDEIINYYKSIGFKVVINNEIDKLTDMINDKVVVLTGQTGAGKSTLLNRLRPELELKTDDISEALNRGKHTTRHVELFTYNNSLIADTPGFSAYEPNIDVDNIKFTFPEFKNGECRFRDCQHINEIGCKVKEDCDNKLILKSRYENYKKMVIK